MPENENEVGWWQSVTQKHAVARFNEDEMGALEGGGLLGVETMPGSQESDLFTFAHEDFPKFLALTKLMKPREQELLISYFILEKKQDDLAAVFHEDSSEEFMGKLRLR